MRPAPAGKNIDDYLDYFASSLGDGLSEDGRLKLRQMLFEQRGNPRSAFLLVERKRESNNRPDPALEKVLTEFWWAFC